MNPVAFTIFNFDIKWYSILILGGIVIGLFLANREAKRFNISKDFMFNLIFWTVIFGFIGARLFYVIFEWDYYKDNLIEIVQIWKGGLAIYGGVIAGFFTILIYTKKYKVSTFKITDIIVPSLILAQGIGRWGNFFNSEAHGAATTLATLKGLPIPDFVINGMNIHGIYYQPTFFYESVWCVLGFIILLILRRIKYIKIGQTTCIYLMWYAVGRFVIEAMRTDSLMLGAFKVSQVISVLLFLTGLVSIIILSRKDKFESLYNQVGNEGNIRF